MQSNNPSLAAVWWPGTRHNRIARAVLLAVAGSLLLTFSAKFTIPYLPVPVTMQTFVVLTLGMLYGWRHATAAVLLYLGEGIIGLPVFAGGENGIAGGLAYFAAPSKGFFTGGYLLGFLVAAAAAGFMAERGMDKNFLLALIALLIADTMIFAFGVPWLALALASLKNETLGDMLPVAIGAGLTPFIWIELSKIALATVIIVGCRKFAPQPRD